MLALILALFLAQTVNDDMVTTNTWNPSAVAQYISQAAAVRGIDPSTAVAVAKTEGLSNPVGDSGHSFGPFQLYTGGQGIGGGLGNSFQQLTGMNPANFLQNWQQQVDYFLNFAVQNGWNPGGVGLGGSYVSGTGGGSHGASAAGIGNRQGLVGSHTVPIGDTSGFSSQTGIDTTIPSDVNSSIPSDINTSIPSGLQSQTGVQSSAQTTANAGAVPPPTGLNLSFAGSIQHVIFQFLLVLVGLALLLGGIYLLGSHK